MTLLLSILPQLALVAMPAQVIIVRHAEKDPVSRQLINPQGLERPAALTYYLTQTDYLLNFGLPVVIFASRSIPISDRIVPRTIETMMPVAEFLSLPIHSPYNGYQVHEMANFVLTNPRYNGKNVLICWNHSSIFDLVNAFGYQVPIKNCPKGKYPDCRFDLTWVMTFPIPDGTSPYATIYLQQLMYGDLTCQTVCPPYPPKPLFPIPVCFTNAPGDAISTLICTTPCPDVGFGDD